MYSKLIMKTVAYILFAIVSLQLTTSPTASAQEFFSGRGIASGNGGSSFSNTRAPQFDQPVNNPLSGIFKKPAFLENLKLPTLGFKKPNIELPTLGNLIPQNQPAEPSMLGKIKTKTDAFFAKAFAFEKRLPGGQQQNAAGGSGDWDSVRKSMESILAERGESNPIRSVRSAGALGDTIQR